MNELRSSPFIAVIIAATVFRIAFALYTPNWQAPDEYAHFYVIRHFAYTNHFRPSKPEFPLYESYQPPLYYVLAAQLYKAVEHWDTLPPDPNIGVDPDLDKHPANIALIVLRLFSVALGVVTLLITARIGSILFLDKQELSLLTVSFVAFLPTFIVNSSSVTNDALANLVGALLLLFLVRPGWSYRPLWLGVILSLGILTKANLWTFFPLVIVSFCIHRHNIARALKKSLFVTGTVIVLTGWFLVWNYSRYENFAAINPGLEASLPFTQHTLGDVWRVLRNINWSFWAAAGRTYQIHLAPLFYLILFLPPTLVATVGVVKLLSTSAASYSSEEYSRRALWILLIAFLLEAAAALSYSLIYPVNCAWGKYLYPVLPAIAVGLVAGTTQLFGKYKAITILPLLIIALIATDMYLFFNLS